jgi:hypothetical protein
MSQRWFVQLSDAACILFASVRDPIDGEELTADEVARCGILEQLRAGKGNPTAEPSARVEVSERDFCHWRGYVRTARVLPREELAHFEGALGTAIVSATYHVRHHKPVWKPFCNSCSDFNVISVLQA